jgi:hypothetical protein
MEVISMAKSVTPETPEDGVRVELMTLGGEIKSVLLNGDHTVRAALIAGGFNPTSEVRVNGNTFKGDDEFENGDKAMVLAGEKVKGGSV